MTGEQIHALLIKEGITPASVEHRGEKRIKLEFKQDARLVNAVKQIRGRKWSKTLSAWHIPKDKKLMEELVRSLTLSPTPKEREETASARFAPLPEILIDRNSIPPSSIKGFTEEINPNVIPYLQRFSDKLMLKGYSYSTLKNYRNHFHSFLKTVYGRKDIDSITKEEIEKYLRWRQKQKDYSESDQNLHINALKFYYEAVLGRERMLFTLPRPKRPHQLPAVWSEEDVMKLVSVIQNRKHRAMLLMAYAHGMRVSEVASLKLADIDSSRMQIHIKAAKGKKDRVVNLAQSLLEPLRSYYKEYKPKIYLFENDLTHEPISMRTIQEVFKAAKRKAGLIKKAGIHSLRHSYATHLHEQGIDIRYLKDLLGHNSLRTTERYTHVSKKDISRVPSPLDRLKF